MSEKENHIKVYIDGRPIVKADTPTTNGRFVDTSENPRGIFSTEEHGEVSVDISDIKEGVVTISGEALRSQSRQAIRKASEAAKGIRKISTGKKNEGGQLLGKDASTGNIKRLSVKVDVPRK